MKEMTRILNILVMFMLFSSCFVLFSTNAAVLWRLRAIPPGALRANRGV